MRRLWPVVPFSAILVATLRVDPGPARAQVSPGWYVIPRLGLAEEYDNNINGASSGKKSDFITRISPGVTFGYQSLPLTVLASYSTGAELYGDNSDLDGFNRHAAGLTFGYLPNQRLTLSLGAAYTYSKSTSGQAFFLPAAPPSAAAAPAPGATAPAATGAGATPPPATTPVIPGVNTGRRPTSQYAVAPSVSYQFDPLTSGSAAYAFSRSDVEGSPADNSHGLTLSANRQLTPLDSGSLGYTFRYFDTEGSQPNEITSSHALVLGYSRQLTQLASASVSAGPRINDNGDVNAEVSASVSYALQLVAMSLAYSRTQDIVTGRQGAQTVDSVTGLVSWIITRELSASLSPRVSFISADAGAGGDTTVYAVGASLGYQINQWLSAQATYGFSYQDETGSNDITRHVVTLGLVAAYPFRVY